MTLSSVMFYTGIDPYTGRSLYVARSQDEKRRQKSYFFRNADGSLRSDQLAPRRGKHGQKPPTSTRSTAPKPAAGKSGTGRDTAQAIRRTFDDCETARPPRERKGAPRGKTAKGRHRHE